MENLMTLDELVAVLKIKKSWVYGHVHSKTLPFGVTRIGRYLRFQEDEVRAYLKRMTTHTNEVNQIAARKAANKAL